MKRETTKGRGRGTQKGKEWRLQDQKSEQSGTGTKRGEPSELGLLEVESPRSIVPCGMMAKADAFSGDAGTYVVLCGVKTEM